MEMTGVPTGVWVLEAPEMGVVGVWNNEGNTKLAAENLAGHPLIWHKLMTNIEFALADEAVPEGPIYTIELHGVRSAADERDPLNDGSAARVEPVADPEMAGEIHRILVHAQFHDNLGEPADCPLCAAMPNPFTHDDLK